MEVLSQIDFGKAALSNQADEPVIAQLLPYAIRHWLTPSAKQRATSADVIFWRVQPSSAAYYRWAAALRQESGKIIKRTSFQRAPIL
jgi:hypothetical protein